jgi:hypothetical protein
METGLRVAGVVTIGSFAVYHTWKLLQRLYPRQVSKLKLYLSKSLPEELTIQANIEKEEFNLLGKRWVRVKICCNADRTDIQVDFRPEATIYKEVWTEKIVTRYSKHERLGKMTLKVRHK